MSEQDAVEKKRGWGLTILIPLSIISAIISAGLIVQSLLTGGGMYASSPTWQLLYLLVSQLLIVIFLIGAWRWQRWGCFGLIALVAAGALVNLLAGTPTTYLLIAAVSMAFLLPSTNRRNSTSSRRPNLLEHQGHV